MSDLAFIRLVIGFAILLIVLAILTGCGHQPPGADLWLALR